MIEIGEETIGNIDHRVRDTGQKGAELGTWIGQLEAIDQHAAVLRHQVGIGPAQDTQAQERIPDRPRNPDQIAGTSAAAPDLAPRRNLADRGQRQHGGARSRDRVAAQEADRETALVFFEPLGETGDPACPELGRKRRRQQVMEGPGCHRRKVRQVDPKELLGNEIGWIARQEMHPGNDRVRCDDESPAGWAVDQCGVIAEIEPARPRQWCKKAPDALEFADRLFSRRICHGGYSSATRQVRASASRTPFASPGSFPVKKA